MQLSGKALGQHGCGSCSNPRHHKTKSQALNTVYVAQECATLFTWWECLEGKVTAAASRPPTSHGARQSFEIIPLSRGEAEANWRTPRGIPGTGPLERGRTSMFHYRSEETCFHYFYFKIQALSDRVLNKTRSCSAFGT